jgi:hypothetical protein
MLASSPLLRGSIAGLAGGLAWFIGLLLFFGPAQIVLTNPDFQSPKMLEAFTADPLPRTVEAPWILIVGLLVIGMLWGLVYVRVSADWKDAWWKRGLRFGIIGWTLMAPWFAFYLPWNVLHEPAALAALELVCWAGVLLLVGLAIAWVEGRFR